MQTNIEETTQNGIVVCWKNWFTLKNSKGEIVKMKVSKLTTYEHFEKWARDNGLTGKLDIRLSSAWLSELNRAIANDIINSGKVDWVLNTISPRDLTIEQNYDAVIAFRNKVKSDEPLPTPLQEQLTEYIKNGGSKSKIAKFIATISQ